jgi:hypothetical protein
MMVNTFLPFADFTRSAKCLDMKRCGKQRVEARQIISTIENPNAKGWRNHPAVNMWRGYVPALKAYFNAIVREWIARGYKNNLELYDVDESKVEMPWWFGVDAFHMSHQASLVRKNKDYYTDLFPDLDSNYRDKGYGWPKEYEMNGFVRRVISFS